MNIVLPRDAFNIAKLIKCIGQASLHIHDGFSQSIHPSPVWSCYRKLSFEMKGDSFSVRQSCDDGSVFCDNFWIIINDSDRKELERYWLHTVYNSRENYPAFIVITGEVHLPVFDAYGLFSEEFKAFVDKLHNGD
ncbi:MAG: hypothetical protein HC888_00665 [Candidatus Competibacteraceae bacterium]|nr:hypothetical protein [Candidatus Competibacteraceae bacterium]